MDEKFSSWYDLQNWEQIAELNIYWCRLKLLNIMPHQQKQIAWHLQKVAEGENAKQLIYVESVIAFLNFLNNIEVRYLMRYNPIFVPNHKQLFPNQAFSLIKALGQEIMFYISGYMPVKMQHLTAWRKFWLKEYITKRRKMI